MDRRALLLPVLVLLLSKAVGGISSYDKVLYKNKVVDMFFHAYHSYMDHAYPADELMPLTCKGRVRGRDRNRGDIDDALGMFSLTLVDSLDTLAVLGEVDEFNSAIKAVVRDVIFDRDIVVSVFETNIRVLGGLLGAHFAAESLKEKGYSQLSWYNGHLIPKAKEVGERLLPAFNTSTGLPYPKVNLRHGLNYPISDHTTCTACAGTMLMEFAALSRVTGDPKFEVTAHRAMEALWQSRHQSHNLVGTIINVQNGEWLRRDSGVGAGSDSYYEYCLKAYILLGDEEYRKRFQLHYRAIMKYISNGPLLVDVSMNSPTRMTRSYMDSLLAFWPGLQVLWGDVESAIHTHDMLYHVTERHNFLPEAFTLDFRVHWGSHPLRPEFSESTYFLYKATGDPYYLDVGKTIVDNLNEYARVLCGFAAIKDLKKNEHEDRMDSFVLAETFKYLYLLFAEEEDTPFNMDDFVFSTEAHIFPLSLASFNSTLNRVVMDARIVMSTPQPSSPSPNNTTQQHQQQQQQSQSVSPSNTNNATPTPPAATPITGPSPPGIGSKKKAPPPAATSRLDSSSLVVKQLQCPNEHRPFVLQDEFEKLVLKQCTSSRFRIRPAKSSKRVTPPRLDVHSIDFSNREHLAILSELGIVAEPLGDGRVQVSHLMQKAKTPADAEEGWFLMQDIMKLMTEQKKMQESVKRTAKLVQIVYPPLPNSVKSVFEVGPAIFGPDLGVDISDLSGELFVLPGEQETEVGDGCQVVSEELHAQCLKKVVMVSRGGCLFIQKVRNAEKAGAAAVIVADNSESTSSSKPLPFSMSGDGVEDVTIPSVFMKQADAQFLLTVLMESPEATAVVKLSPKNEGGRIEEGGGKGGEDRVRMKDGVLRVDTSSAQTVEEVSQNLQKLLEGLDPDILTDKLKNSVAKELQKLKSLDAGQSVTESALDLLKSVVYGGEGSGEAGALNSGLNGVELRDSESRTLNSGRQCRAPAGMAEEQEPRTLHSSGDEVAKGSESNGG